MQADSALALATGLPTLVHDQNFWDTKGAAKLEEMKSGNPSCWWTQNLTIKKDLYAVRSPKSGAWRIPNLKLGFKTFRRLENIYFLVASALRSSTQAH